jgi:hypothetical protein
MMRNMLVLFLTRNILQRFDRTEVIEWLEDYEYFFEVHNTPETYKIVMIHLGSITVF